MKKLLTRLGILLLLFIGYLYIFIPNELILTNTASVNAKRDGIFRNLVKVENWKKWWPGSGRGDNDPGPGKFIFKNFTYTIDKVQISSFVISVSKGNAGTLTSLVVLPDSENVKLVWEGKLQNSYNPLTRLQKYFERKELTGDMAYILQAMQSYLSKKENVYGINIVRDQVVDSILLFKTANQTGLPGTGQVYGLINDLKQYINSNSATQTGFPMLNITTNDSLSYLVKVAIPVNKVLPTYGDISTKLMPGGGNMLITDVKGDNNAINKAFEGMKNYVVDYSHVSPAIPFQSLVTDRSSEHDSTKWITRLYYPVVK